jgi:hypothetical protein
MKNEDDKPASAIMKGSEIRTLFGWKKGIKQATAIVLHKKQIRVEIVPTSPIGTRVGAMTNFLVTIYKLQKE